MMNPKSKMVLTRYLNKLDNNDPSAQEDGEFDASYTEVTKVLDCREETVYEVLEDETPVVVEASSGGGNDERRDGASISSDGPSSSQNSSPRSRTNRQGAERESALITAPQIDDNGDEILLARTKVWQPLERCRKVVEKLWDDPYSSSFQFPVDTNVYGDYLDTVTTPMCLQDVLDKLDAGEYKNQHLNKFANDMRLIWNNCKIYNLHKSQIWYCAHALSLQFERLFQAWVWSFAAGDVFLSEPIGRPWEPICRVCLSDDQENEDLVMLCDHCDASYHIYCLDPPLSSVPEDAWVCSRCSTWLATSGAKCLSATAEDTARTMTDTTREKKVIGVKKKKYLVKWTGLPYSECTWELAKDVGDDQAITAYHKLNDTPPEEPPLTQAELGTELSKNPKNSRLPAQLYPSLTKEVEGNVYSQIRALHFLKSNLQAPVALLKECGPACYSSTYEDMCVPTKMPADVVKTLKEMVALGRSEPESGTGEHDEEGDRDESGVANSDDSSSESSTPDRDSDSLSDEGRGNADDKLQAVAIKSGEGQKASIDIPVKNVDENSGDVTEKKADNKDIEEKEEEEDEEEEDGDEVRAPQPLQWHWPSENSGESENDLVRVEVAGVLSDLVHTAARGKPCVSVPSRPKLLDKEIDVCIGKGSDGLFMNIGSYKERVVVLGFRQRPDGRLGPAERTGLIKTGDILVAINGLYIAHLPFSKIVVLLSSKEFPFVYLRFLRHQNNLNNVLDTYVEKKTSLSAIPSSRPIPFRSKYFGVRRLCNGKWLCEVVEDYSQVTVGTYATEVEAAVAYDVYQISRLQKQSKEITRDDERNESTPKNELNMDTQDEGNQAVVNDHNSLSNHQEHNIVDGKTEKVEENESKIVKAVPHSPPVRFNFEQSTFTLSGETLDAEVLGQREHTAEAKYLSKQVEREYVLTEERLADLDAKNKALLNQLKEDVHSLDSFDSDSDKDAAEELAAGLAKDKDKEGMTGDDGNEYPSSSDTDEWSGASDSDDESIDDSRGRGKKDKKVVNTSTNVTSADMQECGPVVRLLRAVNESTFPPIRHEWNNHILDMGMTKISLKDSFKNKRVEQIDLATGEVMHIWDSVAVAARRLNIPATQINSVLANKLDNGGGFKWRLATASSSVHEYKDEDEDIANAKKKDKNWQEKMHKVSKVYLNGGKLRDYQVDGLNWLLRCWYTKLSSILADGEFLLFFNPKLSSCYN
jgi:hypothetical protein